MDSKAETTVWVEADADEPYNSPEESSENDENFDHFDFHSFSQSGATTQPTLQVAATLNSSFH